MSIKIRLAEVMLDRQVSLTQLSESVGVTMANLSNLKRGNIKAVRFSTLESICEQLGCQPGDILAYESNLSPTGS